jgi:uncharacterized phosphosugar-binding protein
VSAGAAAPFPAARYLDELSAALARARLANRESLAAAAGIVERVVADDGIVYAFGSGHSQLAALEMNRRAGSLACLQVVFDPTWGAAENVEGYGETLVDDTRPAPGDCLIAISHSGTTAAAVEVARWARGCHVPVIAITSSAALDCPPSESSAGPKLHDFADVILDDGGTEGGSDASRDGLDECTGPTSTIVAAALLHQIVADAVVRLGARGVKAPVLRPNSAEGGREHNERLRDRYTGRVRIVF